MGFLWKHIIISFSWHLHVPGLELCECVINLACSNLSPWSYLGSCDGMPVHRSLLVLFMWNWKVSMDLIYYTSFFFFTADFCWLNRPVWGVCCFRRTVCSQTSWPCSALRCYSQSRDPGEAVFRFSEMWFILLFVPRWVLTVKLKYLWVRWFGV